MKLVAMSDLHLGSPHSMCRQFREFLRNLPPDAVLILNGDTVDAEKRQIHVEHRNTLDAICVESFRRKIVWIRGNHDKNFVPEEPNRIEFAPSWSDGRAYFAHGDGFMPMSAMYRMFSRVTRTYRARRPPTSLGTIRLARSLPMLFDLLKKGTRANAVRFAERNGYRTVVCGHLHAVADVTIRGVRYINTGAWTEWPAFYLSAEKGRISLRQTSA